MANRYWVGGSGTWNTTNTANWSDTSGGSGGFSVPALTDAVIIDQAGPYTVTLNGSNPRCLSFNVTGANITIAGVAAGALDTRGDFVIASTTVWTATGAISLNSATTGNVNTNGVSLSAGITLGNGGTYTLQSNLTITGTMNAQVGTFTANNFNVTLGTFNTTGTLSKTLNMGTGTWTITGSGATAWSFASATNLTVNASTSTINMTSASAKTFTGQGKTYGTINQGGAGTLTLVGANTFANITSTSVPSTIIFPASTTTTVSAFGVAGTAGNLVTLNSSTAGTAATLSDASGIINADYLNIKDITATGGATWNAGANSIDSGNNTGWIFSSVPGSRYWVGGAGTWDSATATNWSLTSGGAGGAAAPGSTNDAVFDSASNATAYTVTMGAGAVCANLTMAGPTSGNITWAGSTALSVYGSMTLAATGITQSYTGAITFASTATGKTITTNGVSLGGNNVVFNGAGGGWTLGSALTVNGATLTSGALDLSSFAFTGATFDTSNANTRTLAFGTGSLTLTGNNATIWTNQTNTNLTITGTPVLNCTYSGGTGTRVIAVPSTTEAASPSVNVSAASDQIQFSVAGGTFNNVVFTGFTGSFNNVNGSTLYGNLTFSSGMTTTASANALTFQGASGTKTITTAGVTIDSPVTFNSAGVTWQIVGNLITPSTRTTTLTAGTLDAGAYNVTTGIFSSSNSNVRAISLGSGTWTLSASGTAWSCATATNLTVTPGSSTISLTAATSKTFAGGSKTYGTINQGGAGALTITGANTFINITATSVPSTITFPASTTTTVSAFSVSGTAGNLVTLNSSTAGTRATLSDASGTVNRDYLSIQDISATGGADWYAGANSVDSGNNLGWIFTAAPVTSSSIPYVQLRSFTERGRD